MTAISAMNETERRLLNYLGQSLKFSNCASEMPTRTAKEWAQLYSLADRHEVAVLLGDLFNRDDLPIPIRNDFQMKLARTIHKGITLQSLNTKLTALLEKEGLVAITLKGYVVARFYPVPELRKTSDIDLFFGSAEDAMKAESILCQNGFQSSKEWHANHHSILISEKNEKVEVHTAWADEFRDKRLNRYLQAMQTESSVHWVPLDCNGAKIYGFDTAFQAFYLLIHMLTHFMGSGFGLRNLCDWVVLWENCQDLSAREAFRKMVCDGGIAQFAKAVTAVCTEYLGLSLENSPFPDEPLPEKEWIDRLLRDVLDAGEFGYSESERMVGMEGNTLAAYIKEFHHQMHINFPKAGRILFFWPFLWMATLIRFLHNNRKLNRGSVSAIFKKAAGRGELVKILMSDK